MPKRMAYLTLAPADIDGRTTVVVRIKPKLPQEEMQKAQLAQAFRAPGVDGRPLASDWYIREQVLELEHPDAIDHQIDNQMLPAQSQEVSKLLVAAREQKWLDENGAIKELAERRLGQALQLRPEELMALVEVLVKQRMADRMGMDTGIEQMMLAAEQGGMGGGAGPMGMRPEALPAQFQMTPEEVLPDPATLPAKQARRGKPQNK